MNNHLLIIDVPPSKSNGYSELPHLNKLVHSNINPTIYLAEEGVLWLESEHWPLLYDPKRVIYASAIDAVRFNLSFQQEVIFSSQRTLKQLIKTSDEVSYLSSLIEKQVQV